MTTHKLIFLLTGALVLHIHFVPSALAEADAASPRLPQPFTLTERFGVSHPDQIITFDLATPMEPTKIVITMAVGEAPPIEVPFQMLEGDRKLALRTSLAANESRTFTVQPGTPAVADPNAVTLRETDDWYEIVNGITGVRIPKAVPVSADNQSLPAPLQGVLMRDGTWVNPDGVNPLEYQAAGDWQAKTRATGMGVKLVERGPLVTSVQIDYQFDTPDYMYGQQKTRPAGPGYYTCTITLQAGQPSVLFEEDTDIEPRWSLDFFPAVHPTHARYRGHHSRQQEHGYEPDGKVYRPSHTRGGIDAQVDFTYQRQKSSGYTTTQDTWRWMAIWDPWVYDSGWYWQAFDAGADEDSNLIGIFAGPASRAIGAAFSGVGFWTTPAGDDEPRGFGITMQSYRRSADARTFPRSRFCWGLFVGTRGGDLKPPTEIQPIARQMNLHAGINLDKIHRYVPDFPDPPQGYGAMYMPREAVESLIARLRADTAGRHGSGYHGWLYNAEPTARPLIDFWADTTGEQATELVGEICASASSLLDHFINGDGIYATPVHYWHGGLAMSRTLAWIDQLLASDQTTPEQKHQLKAIAVLFGSILYDNDFVPLDNWQGINLGTPNMPIQQQNYRQMYALFLATHPTFKDRAQGVADAARGMLAQTINEHGAHMGSIHYVGAANGPLLATFQQLRMAGIHDAFAEEERLARFAEFYMQALTPPEVRFGGNRLMVAIGDGSTEGTEAYGMMATGFAQSKPELSTRLMGAWQENGKIHTGFHGSTLLKINDKLPGVSPDLGDASFPGYYAILRSGWGTPEENAVWCVNGNFYQDHCHNDLGSIVTYLLGVPLAIDWGPIYYPRVAGGVMHSTVIQESAFGQPWDRDIQDMGLGSGFSQQYGNHGVGEATSLDVFPNGRRMISTIRSGNTAWVRTVTLATADPNMPILVIRDTFSGKEADAPKIFTLNLMAEGAVETPAGLRTPPLRMHPPSDKTTDPATQLPSAGEMFPLTPGVNRLGFTGQTWNGHPSEGIDWDVYLIADEVRQAHVGNWGNQWNGPSGNLFQAAQGRTFEERQHILRVRGTGAFTTVIVPWKKGQKPDKLTVTNEDGAITIKAARMSVMITPDGRIQ